MTSNTTFSIDYRSPPSGWGQIILPNGNLELIHYAGNSNNNYAYSEDHYFDSDMENLEDLKPVFNLLRSKQVSRVFDSELSYDYPEKFDKNQEIDLETWIQLISSQY